MGYAGPIRETMTRVDVSITDESGNLRIGCKPLVYHTRSAVVDTLATLETQQQSNWKVVHMCPLGAEDLVFNDIVRVTSTHIVRVNA
nr:hypothetical protein Itr_chr15CG08020 [Ipomoea trifida]